MATWILEQLTHTLKYILTDASDYVLVGASEDEYLIFDEPTQWTNTIKH